MSKTKGYCVWVWGKYPLKTNNKRKQKTRVKTEEIMSTIAIQAAHNKTGKTKSPPGSLVAALAAGIPLVVCLPWIKVAGYKLKVLSFAAQQIDIYIDSFTKGGIEMPYEKKVTLTGDSFGFKADDNRISASVASSIAAKLPEKLLTYPLGLLVQRGLYPESSLGPTLALVLNRSAGLSNGKAVLPMETALEIAEAMIELGRQSAAYGALSPAQLNNYLTTGY